jgi:tRNA(adenine34) deaminase
MDKSPLTMHERWMREALSLAASALQKGEFPVGCVLVSGDEVVARGSRLNSLGQGQNELDHAEMVALRQWVDAGKPGKDLVCYSTLEPCLMCTGALIISGIKTIVFAYEDVMGGACGIRFDRPFSLCAQKGFEGCLYHDPDLIVIPSVLRKESIRLFKSFFSSPSNRYLKGTPLENYTLNKV